MISKVLAVVIVLLTGLSGWLGISLHSAKQSLALAEAENTACGIVSDSNAANVKLLTQKLGVLVSQNAADIAAAEAAVGRYNELEAQYTARIAENEALRDELERKYVATATWMGSGMDRRAACSLWPGSATCKD